MGYPLGAPFAGGKIIMAASQYGYDDDWPPDPPNPPDALSVAIEALRSRGLRVAAVGNTPAATEAVVGKHLEVLGSSERWGVAKPEPEFFDRIESALGLDSGEIAYVGDRVDNDVEPALAAGMVAVHIRRGPWGYLHEPPAEALRIESLTELPEALGV